MSNSARPPSSGDTRPLREEDQLLKLNQAPAELSPYAPVAEHWQKAMEYPLLSESAGRSADDLARAYRPISVCMICCISCVFIARQTLLPTGFGSEAADCSCGCKHYVTLAGALGADWGVCTNPWSPRAGLLTFEHQGCEFFNMMNGLIK